MADASRLKPQHVAIVTLSGLFVWALWLGWRPLSAWSALEYTQSSDPDNIVRGALEVARTGNVYATVDPPLRYAPLAIIYWLVGASGLLAQKVAHLFTTLFSFVFVPLSLYLFAREVFDVRVGILTVVGFATWRVLGLGRVAYYNGFWHYEFVLPLVFVALWLTAKTFNSDFDRRLLIGIGVIIGVIGLNQYVFALYTATAIAVALLVRQRVRELALIGATGSLFLLPLTFAPSTTSAFVAESAVARLNVGQWSFALLYQGIADTLTTPGYLLIIVMALAVACNYWLLPFAVLDNRVVFTTTLWTFGLFWLPSTVLVVTRWYSQLAQYVLQYLLLIGIACYVVLFVESKFQWAVEDKSASEVRWRSWCFRFRCR